MKQHYKKFVRDYLVFSRSERNGILVLCAIILLAALLPRWIKFGRNDAGSEWQELVLKLNATTLRQDSMLALTSDAAANPFDNAAGKRPASALFAFDPNQADAEQLRRLGLPKHVTNNLIRYRQAGGRFRKPADLQKIYGLSEEMYRRLEPYVLITGPDQVPEGKTENQLEPDTFSFTEPLPPQRHPVLDYRLELNLADSAELVDLPGIGPVLARRIVQWRERLGGYYVVEQLLEIKGLTPETLDRIRPFLHVDRQLIHRINLNQATETDLRAHPYFRRIARQLVSFREHHGPFNSFADLEKMDGILPDELIRIEPYVLF